MFTVQLYCDWWHQQKLISENKTMAGKFSQQQLDEFKEAFTLYDRNAEGKVKQKISMCFKRALNVLASGLLFVCWITFCKIRALCAFIHFFHTFFSKTKSEHHWTRNKSYYFFLDFSLKQKWQKKKCWKTKQVASSQIPVLIRSMGRHPTNYEMKQILKGLPEKVEFQQFVNLMGRVTFVNESETELIESFKTFDPSNSGFVSITDLQKVWKKKMLCCLSIQPKPISKQKHLQTKKGS